MWQEYEIYVNGNNSLLPALNVRHLLICWLLPTPMRCDNIFAKRRTSSRCPGMMENSFQARILPGYLAGQIHNSIICSTFGIARVR
ncbi:hypothetical protein Pr1d_18670 [Bythopirellula goksoeyrii]|uniref:Uncharacterized protein n=1 Tax=Bythopirellula goksoeyrii TaxID=1400387 RepID=A0A5B9QCD4_9BACT|nr:hypothetical protein Pr1d_18670 [Bythopirellula goksoeyrii]